LGNQNLIVVSNNNCLEAVLLLMPNAEFNNINCWSA